MSRSTLRQLLVSEDNSVIISVCRLRLSVVVSVRFIEALLFCGFLVFINIEYMFWCVSFEFSVKYFVSIIPETVIC